MSDIAIRCDHLSKKYRIGERESYKALRDVIAGTLYSPIRWARATLDRRPATADSFAIDRRPTTGDGNGRLSSVPGHSAGLPSSVVGQPSADGLFWALDDVSFEVKRGEVVGIIGPNGAGKSTLLKILSRITKPTKGRAEIHGRVGSLLEVGTGFHPELTGRENIYLNAAILGMRKAEVAKKFDEIVAFAEVEKFIDTPVKRYSSGMYVRLAFAVAAHLETEILIVDEVLAVGDAQFQKKCLGKMQELGSKGRTVLFVSHSMSAIQRLCTHAILLEKGTIKDQGRAGTIVRSYLATDTTSHYQNENGDDGPLIRTADVRWSTDNVLKFSICIESSVALSPPILGIVIYDPMGLPVFGSNARFDRHEGLPATMKSGRIEISISTEALRPDVYNISLWLGDQYTDYFKVENALRIQVGLGLNDSCQPPLEVIGNTILTSHWRYFSDAIEEYSPV